MRDKNLLIKAIDNYEPYTKSQKKLLSAFVTLEMEGTITTSISSLSQLIGCTRSMIYKSLESLENDKYIKKMNIKQTRISTFYLNYDKFEHLIGLYKKKQEYIFNTSKKE